MTIAEKLTSIAENEQKVFDAGKEKMRSDFWDAYQQQGARAEFSDAFAGHGWTRQTMQPLYNITPSYAYRIFHSHNCSNAPYDLKAHLDALGVSLDFSSCTGLQYAFAMAGISRVGTIDCSCATGISNLFNASQIAIIDKLIVTESLAFDGSFSNAAALKTVLFEGVIGKSLDIHWSPLDKASIKSIVDCLSGTCTGQSLSLSKAAVDTAFETASGAADGSSSQTWNNLITGKSNWTISLI